MAKIPKILQFWGLYSHISAPINVKFGTGERTLQNRPPMCVRGLLTCTQANRQTDTLVKTVPDFAVVAGNNPDEHINHEI